MEVRTAHPADANAISAIAQEVHVLHATGLPGVFQPPSAAVASAADFARLTDVSDHLLLVATFHATVVGYAHAEVQRQAASSYKRGSARLHVHAMGVAAACRGRGVGSALLAALRDEARRRALDGLSLEVYAFNEAARRFYEREGFVDERTRMTGPA
jgi:ribosomal protein S18 acetylase RimI-like enzyme